jgi:SAM-dependent methyltransferase
VSVFEGYSRYYDLLYRDKDYPGEARWVANLIRKHSPEAKSVMEIGCGTGAHAAELAKLGFEIFGVDLSEGMLESARARASSLEPPIAGRLNFNVGDARSVRLGKTFDVVTSLFHVTSYQTSNADIAATFRTVRDHLRNGGVFVFDCWYGPAVLRQWPGVTQKRLSDDSVHVSRRAEPVIYPNDNIVEVNYTVLVTDRNTQDSATLHETHRMRYLFKPEIELALEAAGMKLVDSRAWMRDESPGVDSWGACFIGRG